LRPSCFSQNSFGPNTLEKSKKKKDYYAMPSANFLGTKINRISLYCLYLVWS